MNIPIWQYLVSMPLYIGILLILVELMRKHYKISAIFWILTLFTFPLWDAQLEGWFRWAKTLSVLIPTALIVGLGRIAQHEKREGWWTFFRKDWVLWSLYGVLGLNILEASLKDIALGNYFNAISGFILIVTIPLYKSKNSKRRGWLISKEKPGDLLVYTDPIWNFLYTTWNIAFVFGENPGFAASSLCILLAAELYPIIKKRPELYVTARVYTLAIHILIRSTYDIFTPIMDSSQFANPTVVHYWGIINFALSVPYIFWYFIKRRKKTDPAELRAERV
jgi:hypothetical protein